MKLLNFIFITKLTKPFYERSLNLIMFIEAVRTTSKT